MTSPYGYHLVLPYIRQKNLLISAGIKPVHTGEAAQDQDGLDPTHPILNSDYKPANQDRKYQPEEQCAIGGPIERGINR